MSDTWYPVIDYEKCIECGACMDKCKHGVYDHKKIPTPVVIIPENCIQGCHGCGKLCPVEAISYVGDHGERGGNLICSWGDDNGGRCE